jgi:hypothetical protein
VESAPATVTITINAIERRSDRGSRIRDDGGRHRGDDQRPGERHRSRTRPPALTAVKVTDPAHGTVTLNGDNTVHVHAGRELQRHGQLHVQGERRHGRLETLPTVTIHDHRVWNDSPVCGRNDHSFDD